MGKKDKQRHRHHPAKRSTEPSSSPEQTPVSEPVEVSPIEQMFEARNYQGVIDALRPVINEDSPASDRRMLARALWMCDGWASDTARQEIISLSLAIREKDFSDYRRLGNCYLNGDEYDEAIRNYQLSLECKSEAWTYYMLSIALGRGMESYQQDSETQRPAVKAALEKAAEFDDCPAEVFLKLEDYESFIDDGTDKRIALLSRAVAIDPNHSLARYTLAVRHAYSRKDYPTALSILSPLLDREDAPPAALWLAFVCYWQSRDREKVMSILDRIRPEDHFMNEEAYATLDFVRGIVRFHYGDLAAAQNDLEAFLAATGRPEPDEVSEDYSAVTEKARRYMLATIVCAAIAADHQDEVQASYYALLYSSLWSENALLLHKAIDSGYEEFYTAVITYDHSFFYRNAGKGDYLDSTGIDYAPTFELAAAKLQLHLRHYLDENPEVDGWIRYNQHCTKYSRYYDEKPDRELITQVHLISNLLPVPAADNRLARLYLDSQQYLDGVACHLRYAIWYGQEYEEKNKNDMTIGMVAELHGPYVKKGKNYVQSKYHLTDAALAIKIHDWIAARLDGNKHRKNAGRVFVRFYTPFWRDLLFDHKMWKDLCQVVEALLEFEPAEENLLFDYAYGLSEVGQAETSIAVYRRLVNINPRHYAALHNLAIGLDGEGEYDEALTMANRALALKPKDKGTAGLVESIKNEIEQARRQRPARAASRRAAERSRPETPPPGRAAKATFDSPNEKLFYHALVSLFPNYLVFPNMASSAIFDYETMKGLLNDSQVFEYFLKSRVDFCVVSAISYMPLVAFEVDSSYHDTEKMAQKDSQKDLIFYQGGVPMVRYRFTHEVDVDELKVAILRALKDAGVDLSKS